MKVQLKIRRFNPEKDVENLSKATRAKIEEAGSLGGFLKTPSEIKLGKVEVDLEEHGPIYYLWTLPRRAVNADDVSGLGSKRENKRVPRLRRELKNGWEMAPRPGLEPGTLRLTAGQPTLSNLAGAGVNRRGSASWSKTEALNFSFPFHVLLSFWPLFPRSILYSYYVAFLLNSDSQHGDRPGRAEGAYSHAGSGSSEAGRPFGNSPKSCSRVEVERNGTFSVRLIPYNFLKRMVRPSEGFQNSSARHRGSHAARTFVNLIHAGLH